MIFYKYLSILVYKIIFYDIKRIYRFVYRIIVYSILKIMEKQKGL